MAQTIKNCRQCIVVRAAGWDSSSAVMHLYEKEKGVWQALKKDIPVVLGKNGLGWGRGLDIEYSGYDKVAPVKKEGDGRSPSGIFKISKAFGFSNMNESSAMPYIQLAEGIECIDDGDSVYYNRIVNVKDVQDKDWITSEKMSSIGQYKIGLFIDHNTSPTLKGCGSCIFMHIWKSPGQPTAGCTAMEESDLAFILSWLDPGKHPLLIQFTDDEYDKVRREYNLP